MQAAAASLGSRQAGAAESQAARTSGGGLSLRDRLRQAPQKTSGQEPGLTDTWKDNG